MKRLISSILLSFLILLPLSAYAVKGTVDVTPSGGLAYAATYGVGTPLWTQTNAVQNTYYLVTAAAMVEGPLRDMTTDGSGKITATYAGTYLIRMGVSMENSGTSKHNEYGVSINGATPVMAQLEYFEPASQEQHGSLTRIITLTAGQTIELAIRTPDTGTPNLIVDNLSIVVVFIGL